MPRVYYIRVSNAPPPTTIRRSHGPAVRSYAFPMAVLLTPSHERKRLERLAKMAGVDL